MNIKKVKAGVWVKASEELPENGWQIIRLYKSDDVRPFAHLVSDVTETEIEWLKPVEGSVLSLEELEKSNTDFAEWIYKNQYTKYWGNEGENCDKWYKQYSPPDRKYYTTAELYKLSINQQ